MAVSKAAVDRPKTAGSWLVSRLRDAIISGELPPNSAIRQEDLAERFGVSRMPVRQAIDVLAAEGWVEQKPHRGAVVQPLNADDAAELFEVRFALESLAIRRSFPLLTDEQVRQIEAALEDLEAGHGDVPLLHQSFHLALYAAAGPRLLRLLMQQLDAVQRYLRFELAELHVFESDREEHRELAAAAAARDPERGLRVLTAHIADGGVGIAESLRAREAAAELK
jgi:DNA-binding GntR family transcriptional regulator